MARKTYSVRLEEDTKMQFDAFCQANGFSSSDIINMLITNVVKSKKLNITLSGEDIEVNTEAEK